MIGQIRTYRGQCYVVSGTFERQRRDGTTSTILQWESACAHCGQPFVITTPAASPKFQPNRRCQKHKRPGCPVKVGE